MLHLTWQSTLPPLTLSLIHIFVTAESLADIEAGKVATVIVKDMSRLGRNYLQVGMYTEMIFPQKGVRFIAINDGVEDVYKRQMQEHIVRQLIESLLKFRFDR